MQSMDAENSEIQTTEKPRNFDEDKTNDKGYLFQNYMKRRSSLPIPCALKKFYFKQNVIATKNSTRTARHAEMPALQERSKVIALQRSKVDGTLKENIGSIQQHLNTSKDKTKRAELMGAVEVAEKIQENILFSTTNAAQIYKKNKYDLLNEEITSNYFCAIDTYEKLAKHLNIDQIYIDNKSFLVESKGISIRNVVNHIQTVLEKLQRNDVTDVKSTLSTTFNDILQYLNILT